MAAFFPYRTLLIATHNPGKRREFAALLAPLGVVVTDAKALNLPEPEETGASFLENAELKARAAMEASGLPALADDSGLCVKALSGAPGLLTARWCGEDKNPMTGMKRVRMALEASGKTDHSAYFLCALALVVPGGRLWTAEGRCEGQIVWPPRGAGGHGYDPCFMPNGFAHTFGEMNEEEKQALSHRVRAVENLLALLRTGE